MPARSQMMYRAVVQPGLALDAGMAYRADGTGREILFSQSLLWWEGHTTNTHRGNVNWAFNTAYASPLGHDA